MLKDRVTPEVRSRIMARIGSKETKPEVDFRMACREAGLVGYRKNWGRPSADVVWVGLRVMVFIDGCFWHLCPDHGKIPGNDFWRNKLTATVERDRRTTAHYEEQGWTVLRFWTHTPLKEMIDATRSAVGDARQVLGVRRGTAADMVQADPG